MHDEKSISYISSSNLIIYIIDSVNPLKESHHETIKWLLYTINKSESTIFVINKMDAISDLENDNDFLFNAQIKKDVVKKTLNSLVELKNEPKIVCISADPFGKGLKEWIADDNIINYENLSRIKNLRLEIDHFILKSRDNLFIKTGYSVLKDVKSKFKEDLIILQDEIKKELPIMKNQLEEMINKLGKFSKDISRKYNHIKEELLAYREDLIMLIENSSDLYDLRVKIQSKLGEDAWVVQQQIDLIIKKNTEVLLDKQVVILRQIEESLEFHNELQNKVLAQVSQIGGNIGKQIAEKSPRIIADENT